jgi:iron(III) transport system substrate-binding protein
MMRFLSRRALGALATTAALGLVGCGQDSTQTSETAKPETKPAVVTVYSSRKEHLVKPLFDKFTAQTGTEVRYITDKAGPLMARIQAEGETTPADMLITVDAGNLWQASQMGLLQSTDSAILNKNVPEHLRDDNGEWFGLSVRARTIVYATDRVQADELTTYEALADEKWKGRLCLRTSKKVYNQSLVATMIQTQGIEATEDVVKGWVANLATAPYSNDTKTMEAVLAGQCDVAIVNTYYFGRLKKANPDAELALFWPNQDDRGVHINISGAGITKYAKQPEQAKALLEFLSSDEAQRQLAELNQEYPANPMIKPSAEVASWGEFKADAVNVEAAGSLQAEAVKLMDRAAYN